MSNLLEINENFYIRIDLIESVLRVNPTEIVVTINGNKETIKSESPQESKIIFNHIISNI